MGQKRQIDSPCMGCTKRREGCHDHCVEYDEYKEKIKAMRGREVSDKQPQYTAYMRYDKAVRTWLGMHKPQRWRRET